MFFRNGKDLGVAFTDIIVGSELIYIPCLSLVEGESICANFGARPFRYPVEDYEPLQDAPHGKINQANHIFKWLKNIATIVTPNEPTILDCPESTDISDAKFWNRCMGTLCYHVNKIICSRYCLFNNFLPFMCDIANINEKGMPQSQDMVKCNKVFDVFWLYIKDRYMDKSLQVSAF